MTRVIAFPADSAACGNLRIAWPGETLNAAGLDVTVMKPDPTHGLRAYTDRMGNVVRVVDIDYDVIVVQRPTSVRLAQALRLHQRNGVRIVVDIDDDLGVVHPSNHAYAAMHPKMSPQSNWRVCAEMCKVADLVTVTTPELARRYGSHGRVVVIPNCVPRRYLEVEREPLEETTVGWCGWVGTHPSDLQVTRGAVGRAITRTGARFRNIGPPDGVAEALGVEASRFEATDWVEMEDWPREIARLDVGIVPLEESRFNASKSALKGLEFAATGVPFVASPTPSYREFASLGAGVLAEKPKHWEAALRRLINDESYRAEVAACGLAAAKEYVLEDHALDWWEAWSGDKVGVSVS